MRPMRIRFGKDESGAAMVEFAVVAGLIFIPLLFGILEFGRVIWAKNMVTAAAREGVRFAIVRGKDSGINADSAAVASYVEGRTGLSGIKVSTAWTGDKSATDTVTVTVKYDYTPIVRVPGLLSTKTVTGVSKQLISF